MEKAESRDERNPALQPVHFDRLPCAHCAGSGTCLNGPDSKSCAVCVRGHRRFWGLLPSKIPYDSAGIVCSVCSGVGNLEPLSIRLQKRIVPLLAMFIVYVALYIVATLATRENFSEVLAFAGTLIGSITGYYFGGRQNKT